MTSFEEILFIMPRNRELQFPAMAALQMYVNNYKVKMEANCVTPVMPSYRFKYWAAMSDADWDLFRRMGIELIQDREGIGSTPDSVIELQDERLLSFFNSEKHCGQVCAAISGVETPPFPLVRQVNCEHPDWLWVLESSVLSLPPCLGENEVIWKWDSLDIGDPIPDGIVVGYQSWQTYVAAAMGLPVVEILQSDRSSNWLSKWKNPLYRCVEENALDRLPFALANIREVLAWQSRTEAAAKESAISTVPTESTVVPAASTSATRTSG